MNNYAINSIKDLIKGNSYVGRGILAGRSADGKKAVCAYFIMGRSANSRNRVFSLKNGCLFTEPFDSSKVEDPSLIIYAALRTLGKDLIVTNGDQTDTVYEGLKAGKSFEESLESRAFEPDAPNFTPRISALLHLDRENFTYKMSILKSIDAEGTDCARFTFSYPSKPGLGHFLHTYEKDGNPLPTFMGEPERVSVPDDAETFAEELWSALDQENRISLYVRFQDLESGEITEKLINKNQ